MLFAKENCTAAQIPVVSKLLCSYGGEDGYRRFMQEENGREFWEDRHGLSEHRAVAIAQELIPGGLFGLQHRQTGERAGLIRRLNSAGLTAAQISRITGVSRRIVDSALKM